MCQVSVVLFIEVIAVNISSYMCCFPVSQSIYIFSTYVVCVNVHCCNIGRRGVLYIVY